jgi:hypothetical protein
VLCEQNAAKGSGSGLTFDLKAIDGDGDAALQRPLLAPPAVV